MKYILGIFFCLAISSQSQAQAFSNANDSLSYALGQDLGSYIKKMDLPINKAKLLQAIGDVLEGKEPLFKDEDREQIIRDGLQKIQDEKSAGLKKSAEDFLTKNKSRAGVKVTAEGVQYEVLKEGTGLNPSITDTVKVHYIGKVHTGETFDNSYERGEPLDLELDNVIEGWKIGIPLMKKGAKYRFFIPYNLGYGERGSGPIPPYSTLIFDVELLDIKSPNENAI
ncbi:peptidyl-prolyl cis-trans isomerase [Sphingobacterium mizutaii NBRC 14946 = DSM 11724]|uniref:Peptidyl-prolyl cis-trans isomerase n=2 Tax=Sphingobacterium mizutaii TaxID=1010 RepID=A0AAJ5C0H4_9SPHI|nr:FKBP-type peptidyl-prolyl cis-trans isomerase [Sphingobacterium mizutaii]GEM68947.1 peptidyl-prolyl cis-trans isomerase [Sphingobacterium mizutaii NBRC 14946 = DSM 11724]SDL02593.1 FKBP-type peptidyl-prolyl cis-trans isomerase FkpA [Sphingobacterium mizutaii]SNV50334.1 Probable FKBP-type peptidyl-prolyl cis-trans isomerase [Sphingobacterium mizutaii]